MRFNRAWLWVAAGGVIALVTVSAVVQEPAIRVLLCLVSVTPLLYVTLRVTLGFERRMAQQQRKFLKLRATTDEFIMMVRNLNRLTLASKIPDPPENVESMIEEVVGRMHGLVDRMRAAAGEEEPPGAGEAGASHG